MCENVYLCGTHNCTSSKTFGKQQAVQVKCSALPFTARKEITCQMKRYTLHSKHHSIQFCIAMSIKSISNSYIDVKTSLDTFIILYDLWMSQGWRYILHQIEALPSYLINAIVTLYKSPPYFVFFHNNF